MAILSYSPSDVIVIAAGVVPLTGMADGTFININKEEAPFTTKVTADGVVSRSYKDSGLYTVDITLHSASSSNDVLTKLWILDEATQRAKFPLFIKDAFGTSLFQSTTSWVSSVPDMSFGKEITDRKWTITCSEVSINIGGNEDASALLNDLMNTAIGAIPAIRRMF